MQGTSNYKWPSKIRKFGIQDPFLKILVAKYENEIPWQVQVRNEVDLRNFVAGHMLPRQVARITYPPAKGIRHCLVEARDVDLTLALEGHNDLSEDDIALLRQIRADDGDDRAAAQLALLINTVKIRAFNAWVRFFASKYATEPAFALLLLRPLLDLSPAGSRRAPSLPGADTIDWLFRRIRRESISPDENIAMLYLRKIAAGSGHQCANGWQYFPASIHFAPKLAAACAGSGWCVASTSYARHYLGATAFYVLRSAGKPVVALRCAPGTGEIVECQGRFNQSPAEWFADILLFADTRSLTLRHRRQELERAMEALGNLADMPGDWWQARAAYWPFALLQAPRQGNIDRRPMEVSDWISYLDFPDIDQLLQRAGVTPSLAEWSAIVEAEPVRYHNVPETYRNSPAITDACTRGTMARIEDGEFSLAELEQTPAFIRTLPAFREALASSWPQDLQKRIAATPRSAAGRQSPFSLEHVLPLETDDPLPIVVNHAANQLLANKTTDFSDPVFSEGIRNRPDFPQIRLAAWKLAIQLRPIHWFALPADLRHEPELIPDQGDVTRVRLDEWLTKIEQAPWLMTQQKGVPAAIRFHKRALDVYKRGWKALFQQMPWQIWRAYGARYASSRVYASYALLEQPDVIDAFALGWRSCLEKNPWTTASERMRKMPFLQLALLKSLGATRRRLNTAEFDACQDILRHHDKDKPHGRLTPIELDVRRRLQFFGFLGAIEKVPEDGPITDVDVNAATI